MSSTPRSKFGVNVVGFASGNLGLATAARCTISALVAAGVPVAVADISLGDGHSGHDLTWKHLFLNTSTQQLPYPMTIVHMNPVEAAAVRAGLPYLFAAPCNAIVPFYELPTIPLPWVPALSEYDLVLAPSEHVAAAVRNACPVPVRHFPMACEPVTPAEKSRAEYGIPEGRFVFCTSFDRSSGSHRKNAQAVIRAFQLAFADDDRAFLVIKVNGAPSSPSVERALRTVDPIRCRILDGYASYSEVLGIYNLCDAFVSLHRAEGLGLGLMEAMLLGKPVIATGWSGNMDFMNDENSLPVRYAFTPMIDSHAEYSQARFSHEVCWAEPDVAHAAFLMRRLVSESGLAERLGRNAHATVVERIQHFRGSEMARKITSMYDAFVTARAFVR